jgi:hypothetical protein
MFARCVSYRRLGESRPSLTTSARWQAYQGARFFSSCECDVCSSLGGFPYDVCSDFYSTYIIPLKYGTVILANVIVK